ncbi:SRSF protein kinase 3 [Fragariocoptes setiger]|uniref:non-specific serine/threonine protein kinase n=1 Tax=Fragariocoptes setiger TaxID=1670756 RepID=A0ABQ7S6N3_9ACAR|nr:SRSF protein kinase 3 [Fragariocoptes setiger]
MMSDAEDIEEPELSSDYTAGGYHPVKLSAIFNSRYYVIRKLGWGHFSTVWLCWDIRARRFVALKVLKSAPQYTETAYDEIRLLKCVRQSNPGHPYALKIVQLLDNFEISGPNGTHVCMVFEVLGCNLLKLIIKSNYYGIPLRNVKRIIKQVLQGLHYLHTECDIIHTDIKPENILVAIDEDSIKKLAYEATVCQKSGKPLPVSLVSNTPNQTQGLTGSKMSRNKKKKLKRKAKKNREKLEAEVGSFLSVNSHDDSTQSGSSRAGDSVVDEAEKLADVTEKALSMNTTTKTTATKQTSNTGDNNRTSTDTERKVRSATSMKPSANHTETDPAKDVMDVEVKIADLGNGCYTWHHYTEDIQTRQYRCLEVILGAEFDTASDIWSTACMAFELATGEYLFEPRGGHGYSRDEDHIAHIIELLGDIPKHIAMSGEYSKVFFNRKGELRNIGSLTPWDLNSVLREKYQWKYKDAKEFTDFLLPMLAYDPRKRATALQCLEHPWLADCDDLPAATTTTPQQTTTNTNTTTPATQVEVSSESSTPKN